MQIRFLALCLLLLAIVHPLSLFAQESIELLPDSPIQGEIAERGESDTYTYSGSAGEQITVTMTAADGSMLDTVLELYDSNDEFLASNDDAESSNDTTNSQLIYVLPSDGSYRIVAMAFAGASVGEYTIELTTGTASAPSDPETPSAPSEGGNLSFDEPATGSISAAQSITYSFSASAGQTLRIAVDARPDTLIDLYNADGVLLFSDDDAGPGLNPYLRSWIVPTDGDYTLTLTALPNEAEGEFSLVVNVLEVLESPIVYGDTIEASLALTQLQRYTFEGVLGEVIRAQVTGSFDNYLQLFGPDGLLVAEDDDSAGGVQAGLSGVVLPSDGTYTLEVTGFSPPDVGDYSLSLSLEGQETLTSTETPSTLAYGDTIEATLNAESSASFTFIGAIDDVISISVEAAFDGRLELYDPTGELVASDDDNGVGLNPLIQDFALTSAGQYQIQLSGFGVADSASFTLTLTNNPDALVTSGPTTTEPTSPAVDDESNLSYGDTVEGTLALGDVATYRFGATAGDVITLSATSEAFDGFLEVLASNGDLVISDDDSGGNFNPLIENFTIPATDTYQIVFSSFGGQGTGEYSLSLAGTGAGATATTSTDSNSATQTILEVGTSLRGALTAGSTSEYVFNAASGDVVSLSIAAFDPFGNLDGYVEVYQPDGALLASDDDSGWQFNPALIGLELPQDGTYRVVVSSFAGVGSGDFIISLASGEVFLTPDGQPAQALDLSSGSASLSATLEGSATGLYQFQASQGQTLSINTSSSEIGIYLYTPLDTSEDIQLLNQTEVELSQSGVYLLLLYSATGETVEVQVSLAGQAVTTSPQPDATPAPVDPTVTTTTAGVPEGVAVIPGESLQADSPIRGFINPDEIQTWTFTPALTGLYTVVLNSEDRAGRYDPYIRVLDAAGNILGEDDDSGGEFNAQVADLSLTAGQPIIIEVRGFAEESGGAFFLTVVTEATEAPPVIAGGVVVPGLFVDNALLLRGQQAEFNLFIQQAGFYDVGITGLKWPLVEIYDANGNLIGRGAGILVGQNLPEGTYRLVVYDRLSRTGSFRLSVGVSQVQP
jgi:hypothetical protein